MSIYACMGFPGGSLSHEDPLEKGMAICPQSTCSQPYHLPRCGDSRARAHPLAGSSGQFKEDCWMPVVKNLPANAGDIRDVNLIPGSGRSLGRGHGNPAQYSCLENPHGQRSLAGYTP